MKSNFDMRRKNYSPIDDGRLIADSTSPGSSQSPPLNSPQPVSNTDSLLSRRPSRLSLQLLNHDTRARTYK